MLESLLFLTSGIVVAMVVIWAFRNDARPKAQPGFLERLFGE
jgi:hypothetical protein